MSDDYLTADVKQSLNHKLPASMNADQRARFLSDVGHVLQQIEAVTDPVPPSQSEAQLLAVVQKAADFMEAIGGLSKLTVHSVNSRAFYIAHAGIKPLSMAGRSLALKNPAGGFLGHVWDMAKDMQTIADYAAGKVVKSKTKHPAETEAKSLIRRVAGNYHQIMGVWPPHSPDTKNPWFLDVMQALAKPFGYTVTANMVREVVRQLKAGGPPEV